MKISRTEEVPAGTPLRAPATAPSRPGRGAAALVLALALLTGLLGVAAVLAPVVADDPVVTWPRAGQPPTSTVLPLSPYRPLALTAQVPCTTLAALDARGGGEALRTLPADVDPTLGSGLVVAVAGGVVRVDTGPPPGVDPRPVPPLVSEPLPAGDCRYTVTADASGIVVSRDAARDSRPGAAPGPAPQARSGAGPAPEARSGPEAGPAPDARSGAVPGPAPESTVLAARPDLLPPQVAMLETGADAADAAGLRVELRPDARYQSVPTGLKVALLLAHGLALIALLVAAARAWPGRRRRLPRPRWHPADVVVVAVSVAWVVLGPLNIDDSWYALMARDATASGYVGNAIYQFNVTENPFVLSQYALQAWGALGGWGLAWLRLVPLTYGLVTYAALRWLLAVTLGRVALRPVVGWALAGAHLLWFLGYGITLRPEPLIVAGTAVVWLLVELARRRESVPLLAGAVVVGTLTLTTSPTALVALAPLVLALPWLRRWWRAARPLARVAAVALAAAGASVVVPVGFGDASLGDVLESIAVHRWYYRQHPWHDELTHYANLLAYDDRGSWGRRLPVLLTVTVLVTSLVGLGRATGRGGPTGRLLATSALVTALGLASMTLTPTKWVNHFGAVAAPATVLLALALVRSPLPRRAGRAAVVLAALLAVGGAAVSYAGPNLWRPVGDWGQPFGVHSAIATPFDISRTAPGVGPFTLSMPLLWLGVAAAAVWWARRRGRRPEPDRAVRAVAVAGGVALFVVVFVAAPISHAPGASLATMNLAALTGGSRCGLADHVVFGRDRQLPAAERLAGAPVFADQVSAVLWPCADQVAVRHGIAEVPDWRLRAGDLLEDAIAENSVFVPNGGVLAGVDRTARFIEVPSRLDPAGSAPMPQWGHVELVLPVHPPGGYDLTVGTTVRPGWARLPTLAGQPYTGRIYIG